MTYDVKCYALAEAFLEDEAGINSRRQVDNLAKTIQSAIENWIEEERLKDEPRQDPPGTA
jgi:hypothetical protein